MESQLVKYYAVETTNHFEESYVGKLWYIVLCIVGTIKLFSY